jgi:AcrR family transcriptional regulator
MARASSRERILDAAQAVVLADGAAHLTLDAVAARAGLSKGGLIYNFPSKDALLRAMMERLIREMEKARRRVRARLAPGPAREIKAHVLSFLNPSPKHRRLCAALLAALAHDPRMVNPVNRAYRATFDQFIAHGLAREEAAVIALAVDGLFLLDLLNVRGFAPRERGRIVARLLRLADEAAARPPRSVARKTRRTP